MLCFLICGCGEQGEQGEQSKVEAIEWIDAYTRPNDWTGDGTDDGVCIYIIFHDRNDHVIKFADLSCTVDFRFHEMILHTETFLKGKLIHRDTVDFHNANLLSNADCAVRILYEELPSSLPDVCWLDVTVLIERVGRWKCTSQAFLIYPPNFERSTLFMGWCE